MATPPCMGVTSPSEGRSWAGPTPAPHPQSKWNQTLALITALLLTCDKPVSFSRFLSVLVTPGPLCPRLEGYESGDTVLKSPHLLD